MGANSLACRAPRDIEWRGAATRWQRGSLTSTAEVPRTLGPLVGAMILAGYPEADRFGMRLAVEEALVNAVKHGHKGDSTRRVWIRYQVTDRRVLVEVADQGNGFDPQQVPDPRAPENLERPGGRGLLLMRSYTSWLRYHDHGRRLTLCKWRSLP
jgi:serine/threonine-protein kinase RsbW